MIPDEAVEAAAKVVVEEGAYGAPWGDASDSDREDALKKARAYLEAAAPYMPGEATEWGVMYVTEAGDLHTEWGYVKNPICQVDRGGKMQVGKREWGHVYEIFNRPAVVETSVWQSDDCPWKEVK